MRWWLTAREMSDGHVHMNAPMENRSRRRRVADPGGETVRLARFRPVSSLSDDFCGMSSIEAFRPLSSGVRSIGVRLLSALLLLFSIVGNAGAPAIEVISLSHRQASELADLVRPLLGAGETVVAHGSRLIVKAGARSMAEIRQLIDQLDKPLARLQISVLQSDRASADRLNAQAAVHGRMSGQGGHLRGNIVLEQSVSGSEDSVTQRIQTMEGRTAHIEVGEAFPIAEYRVSPYGARYFPNGGVTYHQATTGFAVVPSLVGDDEVLLDVAPWSDRLQRSGPGIVATRSAHTTIRARLGTWVEFGGKRARQSNQSTGLFGKSHRYGQQDLKLFIRVDRLN